MTLVFVYGTLKRGSKNHRFLAGQALVDEAHTAPGYALYELEGYPGMVHQGDDLTGVSGEVWLVDDECLARLDLLECTAAGLFRRETVRLREPFAEQKVEAYFYLRSIKDLRNVGGEWLQ